MKKTIYILALIITASLVMQSCGTRKVERIDTEEIIDLSGRWNDSDSRMVAEAMVDQILGGQWLQNFRERNDGDRPVVIVGLVYNRSHEHIEAGTFIKDVERAFVQSGKVRLVQAGDKREELRAERAAQQEFASPETQKKWGQELGADFILNGDINSIVDTYKNERDNMYQVNLELTDIETSEIVWIGEKKIRKYIKN